MKTSDFPSVKAAHEIANHSLAYYREMMFTVGSPPQVPCNCRGPQNGEPVCPCQMAYVKIVGGRYIKTVDLGPAPATSKGEA